MKILSENYQITLIRPIKNLQEMLPEYSIKSHWFTSPSFFPGSFPMPHLRLHPGESECQGKKSFMGVQFMPSISLLSPWSNWAFFSFYPILLSTQQPRTMELVRNGAGICSIFQRIEEWGTYLGPTGELWFRILRIRKWPSAKEEVDWAMMS